MGTTARSQALERYRAAADYLAAAQIYLRDNVLLRERLRPEHLKPQILGHWGTCPGITFFYAGLDRLIRDTQAEMLLVTGPGHGAAAVHANLWLEGSHGQRDPRLSRDLPGLNRLVRRFSVPGGAAGNLSPDVPGSIHEGGEVGYALATAVGAALDAPERIVACIVGDGEAETAATAAAWQSTSFLDPVTSGAVLPLLQVNHHKIGSPTVFGVLGDDELHSYFRGGGWDARFVDVEAEDDADEALAVVLDAAYHDIRDIQRRSRSRSRPSRPQWPLVIVRSPKGWGTVARSGGRTVEGTFHSHHLPIEDPAGSRAELELLEEWLSSYRPGDLFGDDGRPAEDLLTVCPEGDLRLGCTPGADGGRLRRELPLPALERHAPRVEAPAAVSASPMTVLGGWFADLLKATDDRRDFRIVSPDELTSNKLDAVLDVTSRAFARDLDEYAEHMSPDGRVMEVLSEHLCQGWLQGYVLTGRHGVFPSYEAFVEVVSSMLNQYAKFVSLARDVSWRAPVSGLTYVLTSQGWRQHSNGYTHMSPGFINQALLQPPDVARVYLPPDATTALVTMEHCLASTDVVNLVVAGKGEIPVLLDLDAAREHCRVGVGTWDWASNAGDGDVDVVLACAGDVPTKEALAAAQILRDDAPWLRLRFVNVVDLLALAPAGSRSQGLSSREFERRFGVATPVVFAFHGYPSAVHDLVHGRPEPGRFRVCGFREQGGTTTPHHLLLANGVSRHHLAIEVLRQAGGGTAAGDLISRYEEKITELWNRIHEDGTDPPEIQEWRWR